MNSTWQSCDKYRVGPKANPRLTPSSCCAVGCIYCCTERQGIKLYRFPSNRIPSPGNVLDRDPALLAKQSSRAKQHAYVNPLHYLDNRTVATPLLHGTGWLCLLLCGGNGYCTLQLLYGTGDRVVAIVTWIRRNYCMHSEYKQLRPSIFSHLWTSTCPCPSSKE